MASAALEAETRTLATSRAGSFTGPLSAHAEEKGNPEGPPTPSGITAAWGPRPPRGDSRARPFLSHSSAACPRRRSGGLASMRRGAAPTVLRPRVVVFVEDDPVIELPGLA